MTRLLVTGGSGFIGAWVVEIARSRGYEIRNLDWVQPHIQEHAAYWIKVDIRDKSSVMSEVARFAPDYVVHLASDTDVSYRSLEQFKTTIDGTRNIIESVKQLHKLRRFIHVSTQYVVRPGVFPPDERYLCPYTVYGEAKAETERIVWNAELGSSWIIVRPTTIWGPVMHLYVIIF